MSEKKSKGTSHFVMQSKGGVGKSFVAWLLAQYLLENPNGKKLTVFDTDIANHTVLGFKGLPAEEVPLVNEANEIDPRKFDSMMERMLSESGDFVIDTGSNVFPALWNYMVENQAASLLQENGRQVVFHTVIVGGQALVDTVNGLASLGKYSESDKSIVVWLNDKFGPVEHDGKGFEDFAAAKQHESKIFGTIRIRGGNASTEGVDITELTKARMTFKEADASDKFNLMARQRLRLFKRRVFEEMAGVLGAGN
jgi:hypothetical protein